MQGFTILMWLGCGPTEKESAPENIPQPEATPEPASTQEPADDEPCAPQLWYADDDGDGFGDPYASTESCTAPAGYVENNSDCDDADAEKFPGQIWYADQDQDGFGDSENAVEKCSQPFRYVLDSTDCDDTDETRNPDTVWYEDTDGDGFGNVANTIESCSAVSGFSPLSGDCDDSEILTHPDAYEICDGIDNDCDELIDDADDDIDFHSQVAMYVDIDLDGVGTDEYIQHACASTQLGALVTGDCDDTDPTINPNQMELPDEIDQNCDGESAYQPSSGLGYGFQKALYPTKRLLSADVNGDGSRDVLMHAPNAEAYTGSVMFVKTTPDLDFSNIDHLDSVEWTGEFEGDQFGQAVAAVGDMDGNGVHDVLVSAAGTGKVYLINTDTPSGTAADAQVYWEYSAPSSSFGEEIFSLGDIDGDGTVEAIVTDPGYYANGESGPRGAVFLLDYDPASGTQESMESHSIVGAGHQSQLSASVDNIGDADGDGIDDLIMGAAGSYNGLYGTGYVYLVSVQDIFSSSFSLGDATLFYGHATYTFAGTDISHGIGDYNGDGYQDFLVLYREMHSNTKRATIVFGQSSFSAANDLGEANVIFLNAYFDKLAPAGDLNADGFDDFLVSLPNSGESFQKNGVVQGYLGSSTNDGTTQDMGEATAFTILGSSAQRIGTAMTSAGDVNGDGFDDVWLGTGSCSAGWQNCDQINPYDSTYLLSGIFLD